MPRDSSKKSSHRGDGDQSRVVPGVGPRRRGNAVRNYRRNGAPVESCPFSKSKPKPHPPKHHKACSGARPRRPYKSLRNYQRGRGRAPAHTCPYLKPKHRPHPRHKKCPYERTRGKKAQEYQPRPRSIHWMVTHGHPNEETPEEVSFFGNKKWPNRTMYYEIDPKVFHYQDRRKILKAFCTITTKTKIKFKKRKPKNKDWVFFVRQSEMCSSPIGRMGGRQLLNLGEQCMHVHVIIHEVMHALGLPHEHCRADRDQYIIINWDNVSEGKSHNFKKDDSYDTHFAYDFKSIMHYDPFLFAKDESIPTIIPRKRNVRVGGRRMSAIDIQRLKTLYKRTAVGI